MRMSFDPRHVGDEGESRSLLRDETSDDAGCWGTGTTFENGARPRRAYLTLSSLVIGLVSVCVVSTTTWSLARRHRVHARRRGGAWPSLPHHCDDIDYELDLQLADAMRSKLAESTFVGGFWRLRKAQHSSWEYATKLRNTVCKLGSRGVNVVFVEDSPEMCEFINGWYDFGRNSTSELQALGHGRKYCHVMSLTEMPVTATQCRGRISHAGVWLNKVPVFGEVVAKVESGEIASEMKSSRYFWLDGDIDFVPKAIGEQVRERYFEGASNGGKGVEGEGKFWAWCYDPAIVTNNRQCPWMGREVNANMFGGSASAIAEYAAGYMTYVNLHVPTRANRGRPPQQHCACPYEEHVMTGMASDPAFSHLYGPNSCARLRREPRFVD